MTFYNDFSDHDKIESFEITFFRILFGHIQKGPKRYPRSFFKASVIKLEREEGVFLVLLKCF